MGRHINNDNSSIYLVQNENDANSIKLNKKNELAVVTQTTLSVDETKSIISILRDRFPKIITPKKTIFVTRHKIDKML